MYHGEAPTTPENVLSPLDLPLRAADPNLSPVPSSHPSHASSYQSQKLQVRIISGLLGLITLAALVVTGVTRWIEASMRGLVNDELWVLFGVFGAVGGVLFTIRLPLAVYSDRVLEREFGLLTQSIGGWIRDLGKGLLVGLPLAGLVLVALYRSILDTGEAWWFVLGSFLFVLQLILAVIGPRIILPFLYKLTPLEDGSIRDRIGELCTRAGIAYSGIFVIGFGERTKKANAALTGLGRSRRIVLSDTLLQNLRDDEVAAVFAHESGHLKLGHIWLGVLSGLVSSYGSLYLVSIAYGRFAEASGTVIQDIALLPMLGVFLTLVSLLFRPASLAVSRWQEYAADAFAVRLTREPEPLANALEKLSRINLSDPDPHPVLEFLTFSHPSLRRRLARIRG